jgi:hypothetical protein
MMKKKLLKNFNPPYTGLMKELTFLYALVLLFSTSVCAETLKFKVPALNGKLNTTNLELTDLQSVINCHFNFQGNRKQIIRYPQTDVKKLEGSLYSLKIKSATIGDSLPHLDLLTCAYKLIVIGKNKISHQPAYGEIFLIGKETGTMSDSELQTILDFNQLTKVLNEKTKELTITYGKDGGIGEEMRSEEK